MDGFYTKKKICKHGSHFNPPPKKKSRNMGKNDKFEPNQKSWWNFGKWVKVWANAKITQQTWSPFPWKWFKVLLWGSGPHIIIDANPPYVTLTLSRGWWGRCEKKLSPEGGKKGRWIKKSARSEHAWAKARTWDLPRVRRGAPAARHGGCLDKQDFPCL